MRSLKVLCMCPGSWTHGLDSPERGEGRWSQNYAKMLAHAGHDVYAASMGSSSVAEHYGVKIIHESHAKNHGPYDVYIDSAWWDNKEPKAQADIYIALKWSLEDYLKKMDFPDNFYLAYPYPSHHHKFCNFKNSGRTFALPTMFGVDFSPPNWDKTKVFLPGKIDLNRDYKPYLGALSRILDTYPVEGCSPEFFKEHLRFRDHSESYWFNKLPYDQVIDSIKRCKVSLPILNPGCTIEAAFQGVPSICWQQGEFFEQLAQSLDLTIQYGSPPERLTDVFNQLYTDKKKYMEVVQASQDFFTPYTFTGSLKYFNLMMETIR